MEQLADFVRNPLVIGHQREQQSDAANSERQNSVRGGSESMAADRTLLIKVRLELYPISWEILDKIFSKFGMIEYLEVFCRGEEYHSMIRFQKRESAMEAFESLNHREIYDNWCRLELFLLSLIEPPSLSNQEEKPMTVGVPMVQDSPGIIDREFKGLSEIVLGEAATELVTDAVVGESAYLTEDGDQEIDALSKDLVQIMAVMTNAVKKPEKNDDLEETLTQHTDLKVNLDLSEFIVKESAINELGYLVNLLIELWEIRLENFGMKSVDSLSKLSARKMFAKMSGTKLVLFESRILVGQSSLDRNLVLGDEWCYLDSFCEHQNHVSSLPFDRGRIFDASICCVSAACLEIGGLGFVFDPGISNGAMSSLKIIKDQLIWMSSDGGQGAATVIDLSKSLILVFDPGGFLLLWAEVSIC